MRLRLAELSPRRVLDAATRRLADVPQRLAWAGAEGARNRDRLAAYRDRHRGERCFILGNGPSLAHTPLDRIRDPTFGTNRVYLAHQPTYYVCVNELVLEQWAADIAAVDAPRFLNWNRRGLFADDDRTAFVRLRFGLTDRFTGDPRRPLSSGGTVTFVALQLAWFMGFSEVILAGVDHRFADKGPPNRTEVRAAADANHFHPGYFPPGARWQLPDLHRSELAYAAARRAFAADGRRVRDATLGGACPSFEKVSLEEVLSSRSGRPAP